MNKKIKYIVTEEFASDAGRSPVPSIRAIPKWYKEIPGTREIPENSDIPMPAGKKLPTVKRCIPILDSMSLGYVIELIEDVYFDEKTMSFLDPLSPSLDVTHPNLQIDGYNIGENYHHKAFKWNNYINLKTPKGYSLLFTHPIHRLDLPFYSFSGLVDSDVYPLNVLFPFFIKKGFSGVIPKGTPIIQFIPIKRENWKIIEDSMKEETNNLHSYFHKNNYDMNEDGIYLKKIRQKKEFK